jgi:hypothetical protein
MADAVRRRTVVVLLLVVTLLSAGIGAGVAALVAHDDANPAASPTADPLHGPRRPYTPVADGNGVTIAAVWSGNYERSGRIGVLSVTGHVTAPWTGQGFLELSLPRGWRAQRGAEAATITGWTSPKPSTGVHYGMIGVVHPGATKIRFIAGPVDGNTHAWLAVDGVSTPTRFTGDADPDHQTEIHAVGWVLLD